MSHLPSKAASAAILSILLSGSALVACSGATESELFGASAPGTHSVTTGEEEVTEETPAEEPGAPPPSDRSDAGKPAKKQDASAPDAAAPTGCTFKDAIDHDGDGLSFAAGDCNDCDPRIRPGRIDQPGNGLDEDCSGKADDDGSCDTGLALASNDAALGARALGVCHALPPGASAGWGIVSARYVKPDGTPLPTSPKAALGHGLLPSFGSFAPRYGATMLGLSSGAARAPSQPDYKSPSGLDKGYGHGLPSAFARTWPACTAAGKLDESGTARDGIALELQVKVPMDARSMSFEHALFTYDFSESVCSAYADSFAVLMVPPPPGAVDGNLVSDPLGGPLGVNSPLLQTCSPGTFGGLVFACGNGAAGLAGTGFEGRGGTGWLRTTTPVTPGAVVTLLFAVWDSSDGHYDTTVLLDSLRFWPLPVSTVSTSPI